MKAMNMKSLILGLTISILSFSNINAQDVKLMEKKALESFKNQNYEKALGQYLELDAINPASKKGKYDYMIGMCYLSTSEKTKALPFLENAKENHKTSYVVYYYLGRAYMIEGNFEKATENLKIYQELLEAHVKMARLKFTLPSDMTDASRVHLEKTPEVVSELIAQCEAITSKNLEQSSQVLNK